MHKDNGSEGSAFAREDCTLLTRSFLMVLDDVESRCWPHRTFRALPDWPPSYVGARKRKRINARLRA